MRGATVYHFRPERIMWVGGAVLAVGLVFVLFFVLAIYRIESSLIKVGEKKEESSRADPLHFSFGLSDQGFALPTPSLQTEMSFSFDPPRPMSSVETGRILVRMKRSGESKRALLPCRIDLAFEGDKLRFAEEKSSFWVELTLGDGGQIAGRTFLAAQDGKPMDGGGFTVLGLESPIQLPAEFIEGSPFRILAESKWWGRDQFHVDKESGERIEIGSGELFDLKVVDWLVWKEGKWQKSVYPDKELPIAHIESVSPKGVILEGWDMDGHVRLLLSATAINPFKVKAEDLFSAIRVRSEKQISCMLEKQCLILKTGDWVFKTGGRWKVLRKKEERDAFTNGKLFGELFVFEQIAHKQGQKMVQGKLFNPGRTQVVSIEIAAQAGRRPLEKRRSK